MGNVFRCYVEKKPGFAVEAEHLFGELRHTLGLTGLTGVRVLRRYDVEGVDAAVYAAARTTVLSEPQVDALWDEVMPAPEGEHTLLAVEALPGQYDQRADSCAQCIQMMHGGERPTVRAATVYVLEGALTTPEAAKARGYLINPVESREAALDKPATLRQDYPVPAAVPVLDGFTALDRAGLESVLAQYALAMDLADLAFLQAYFRDEEGRDPTLTEVRVVDTYWSDHCRHTTFSTHLDAVEIADDNVKAAYERYLSARVEVYGAEKAAKRPQTLMDIATLGAKTLKKRGLLPELDESEEINACSIHVPAQVDGKEQDWLLMFKNETHNHPTEIEPFGGAATCIGGCIRDPLSGRVYVHQAMRFTGGGDTLLYRVGPGGGDVSGDYNAYPDTWSVEAGGVSVTCKGADGTVSLALWERDGYSFSLSSEHGLSTVAVEAAAAGAQQKDGPAWQARPFLVRVGAGLPDFGLEALQVLKALRPLAGVPQQGGGVVHGHHPHPGLFDPLAMLTGDFEVLLDELHGGDASQADDDLRFEQGHLVAQIADTGLLLNVQGVPVLGRAALDHVADEHLLPLQVDHGQHIVQQLARPAHKGPAGAVLLLAGALPDEHDLRVPGSLAEHHVGPGLRQAALLTVDALLIEGVPILHSLSPQCVVFDIVPHPRPRCKKILCLTFAFKLRILRSTKAERTTAPREGRQRIRVTD